jgi:hypothetical protein
MSAGSDRDAIVDRWLAEQHKSLIQELAANLDLEAGLHDAMIPARHASLLADLRETLDLESGLGAIVPRSTEGILERDSGETQVSQGARNLRALIRDLSSNSPRDLLEFRTHTIWSERVKRYRCGCLDICMIIMDFVSAEVEAIEQAFNANRDRSFQSARTVAVVQGYVDELGILLARTRQFDRGFNTDIDKLRNAVGKLVGILDASNVLKPVRDTAESLRADLNELDEVLNDFTGVDLSNTNLQGIRLDGVRWSPETQWPNGWADKIRNESIEIAPGIFEIRADRPHRKGRP